MPPNNEIPPLPTNDAQFKTLGQATIQAATNPQQSTPHQPPLTTPPNPNLPYKRDQRMNNGTFAVCWVLLQFVPGVIIFLALLVPVISVLRVTNGSPIVGIIVGLTYVLLLLYLFLLSIRIAVYRFWDMNKSSLFVLLYLLPLINIGILIWLIAGKSYPEATKHGPIQTGEIQIKKMFSTPRVS